MRVLQLLAIAMVCPLAGMSSSCRPIEQPIGQYQAASRAVDGAASEKPPISIGQAGSTTQSDSGGADSAQAGAESPEPPVREPSGSSPVSNPPPTQTTPLRPPTATTPSKPTPGATQTTCIATTSVTPARKRLDMYIVLDANITLPYTGLWEFISTGLRSFVRDPLNEGIGVGLRYFGEECDPETYDLEPTVEVGSLPDNEDALVRSLSTRQTFPASPMAPALEGGITHQSKRAESNPDVKQVVVLATDGFTGDIMCPYSVQELQDVAEEGFSKASNPIETYIIGFGSPDTMNAIADDILARFSPLDSIARRGGTRQSIMLKSGSDSTPAYDAFTSVRRTAQPCAYDVPEDIDPANLNLVFFPTGQVPRVDDPAECGNDPGYYYEPSGAAKPTTITLCRASCLPLQNNDYTPVVLGGCPSMKR